jgi:hypothetical protein
MDDYRTRYATPQQVDTLWTVIGSMRRRIEELTRRLERVEGAGVEESVPGPGLGSSPGNPSVGS